MDLWSKILNASGLDECESIANHLCASIGKGVGSITVQGILKGKTQKITNITGLVKKIITIKGCINKPKTIKGKIQTINTIKGNAKKIEPLKGVISKC